MAVESNGKAVAPPAQEATNGHATSPKSKSKSKPESKPIPTPKSITSKKSIGFGLFSIISRILTWYSIATILLRCPATPELLTTNSPKICKPYFQLKSAALPHLEPYYDIYAVPYVNAVRPYYESVDNNLITPVIRIGKKYGAPRVEQVQAYGQAQWEKILQPQVLKYQAIVTDKYDQTLGPHVGKVVTFTNPYYEMAKTNAQQTYYGHILPTYTTVQPYAVRGYGILSDFTINTAVPCSKWAWKTGAVFFDRTVWPRVRILYGENVEPQLVRIGERLGRYRDGKKLKAVVDAAGSSASTPSTAYSTQFVKTTAGPSSTAAVASSSGEVPQSTPLSEKQQRENAQKIVAKDLKIWQEKFAKAADEGSDDLEERMTEITDRLIKNQAKKVGDALIIELEETAKSSLKTLKHDIINLVKAGKNVEESEDELSNAVRKAGVAIKGKAQAVRTWRQSFDQETNSLISEAASETFEILDHIQDLGLQEIGMRWAWTDGITHRDWAKYHKLKGKFDEWRGDVEAVVVGHPGLADTRAASEAVQNKAMEIAEEAAKELARLKETGRWKISTSDVTDDFSTKHMPAPVVVAGQKLIKKFNDASEALAPSSRGTVESIASQASSSATDGLSSASSFAATQIGNARSIASSISASVVGTPQGSVESIISAGSSTASGVLEQASNSIIGTQQGSVESIVSVAKASANSVADQASSSIIGASQGTIESIVSIATESPTIAGDEPGLVEKATASIRGAASVASDSASSLSNFASSSILSGSSEISKTASKASSLLSSVTSSIASSLSKSVSYSSTSLSSSASIAPQRKVWGGAMAQHVEARQIVYDDIVVDDDDEDTFSEKIQSMASEAGDQFADVTRAVSEALLKPTTTQTYQVTDLAVQKYSSALAAASSALYGPEPGTGESIAIAASSRYSAAVSAASVIIYGTPAPITAAFASQASEAYSSAVSRASEHYSNARSIVSAQISGEPKPVHEQMFSSVESAYNDAITAANLRLKSAVSAASTGIYGAPQGALESATSVAQSRLSEGLSAASSRYADATNYVAAINTGAPQQQKLLLQMQEQYYAGIGMAHARYSEFLSAASSAVMPTPTPFHESLYSKVSTGVVGSETPLTEVIASVASINWAALVTKASEQVYGAPTPYFVTRRLLSEAKEYGAQVTDAASSRYAVVQSLVSELVSGKEPDYTASVYSRLSSAYYTGAQAAASSASSYAGEVYASASSVVSSVFTPPPAIEGILGSASSQINDVVEAASVQIYGTQKGNYEKATSDIAAAASSAQAAISEAIYGTPTGAFESATSAAAESYSSATSIAVDAYSSVGAKISTAIYGPEQGAVESAQARLSSAVESARARLAEFAASAGDGASDFVKQASEGVENFASGVSSVVSAATAAPSGKDEL